MTRKTAPERPKRLQYVMTAVKQLRLEDGAFEQRLDIQEVTTSAAMLSALSDQCCQLAQQPRSHPMSLSRTASVGYLEEKIVPAVRAVHTQSYLQRLASTCVHLLDEAARVPKGKQGALKALEKNLAELDGDTSVSASSLSAALCAVLSCCYAVDACCDANLPYANAFAVIRPPGHHAGSNGPTAGPHRFAALSAERSGQAHAATAFAFATQPAAPCDGMDCSQGFCLLNNAAIAARHALLTHPATIRKVAIVDIDLHHGNGTEEIVRGWSDVMYVSLHGVGDQANGVWFYPDTATTLQLEERLVNVPLPQGTTSAAYLTAFDAHVTPALRRFSPDLILISCGFDACAGDSPAHPEGYLQLDPRAFAQVTERLTAVSHELCGGRLVSLFEGGYKQRPLHACARAHVCALSGVDYDAMVARETERLKAEQASAAAHRAERAAAEMARLGVAPAPKPKAKPECSQCAPEDSSAMDGSSAAEGLSASTGGSGPAAFEPTLPPPPMASQRAPDGIAALSAMDAPASETPAFPLVQPVMGPPAGLVRTTSRVVDRVEQDREVAALMRGNSSVLTKLDVLRIQAGTPESIASEATQMLEDQQTPTRGHAAASEEPPLGTLGHAAAEGVAAVGLAAEGMAVEAVAGEGATSQSLFLPEAADVGRRVSVRWPKEDEWFNGVLTAIEAGHDDGEDAGNYHVLYDDGDEQWEPLGSRTPFRWVTARPAPTSTSSSNSSNGGAKRATGTKAVRKARRPPQVASPLNPASTAASAPPAAMLPTRADVGRRLSVYWAKEGEWFPGVLQKIEAGHDDGEDAGDYHVLYDDGDEQWEPLGSRTPFRWAGEPPPSSGHASPGSEPSPGGACGPSGGGPGAAALSASGSSPPSRPRCKRMLSERSNLAALPEAKLAEVDLH